MTDRLIHRPTDDEFAHLHRLASEGSLTAAAQLPMSAWAEERRHLMTPQTIAMNAQLHRQAPEGSDVPPLFSVRVKDLPVGTEFLVRSKENGGFSGPIYADGYGRVHVLVPKGPKQREEAVYAMVAFQAPRVATPVSSIYEYARLNAYEAPTSEWDQSPAFGGVDADTTGMAHYIEYPED